MHHFPASQLLLCVCVCFLGGGHYGGADFPWTDCTEIKLAMQLSVLPVINNNNTMDNPFPYKLEFCKSRVIILLSHEYSKGYFFQCWIHIWLVSVK